MTFVAIVVEPAGVMDDDAILTRLRCLIGHHEVDRGGGSAVRPCRYAAEGPVTKASGPTASHAAVRYVNGSAARVASTSTPGQGDRASPMTQCRADAPPTEGGKSILAQAGSAGAEVDESALSNGPAVAALPVAFS